MILINKLLNCTKQLGLLSKLTAFSSSQNVIKYSLLNRFCNNIPVISSVKGLHTTPIKYDLMEFFEDKKNWGLNEIKCGRSWTKDELRIKSNSDLHKLWFILLKERNMLLTMEHECKDKLQVFANPERIDKVKDSMQNLEEVVRERNKAYYLLETGTDGERPGELLPNELGVHYYYRHTEHLIPKFMNRRWKETHKFYRPEGTTTFLRLYREKLWNVKRKQRNRDRNHVMHLLRRNPNLDRQLLADKYPNVDIKKLLANDKCRGHFKPIN